MAVERIHAREILDSRGNPTVEVDLYTHKGMWVRTRDGGKSCAPWLSWHCMAAWHTLPRAQRVFSSETLADSKPGEVAETKILLVALLVRVLSNSAHVPGESQQGSWLLCI